MPTAASTNLQHLTAGTVTTWYQQDDVPMVVGDALTEPGDAPLTVGFARYQRGAANEVTLPYDEVLVVTRGSFTVHRAEGSVTAGAGEVIYHRAGAAVRYEAGTDAEVVYVCHPALPMRPAGGFHVAADPLPAEPDNVRLLQRIWEPLARGESTDLGPFFDSLDDGVLFTTPAGALHGKPALVEYFAQAAALLDARPFERPLEYYGSGDTVVVLGDETFRVKASGATSRAAWAWVHQLRAGRVTRITAIQDLSAVAEVVAEALDRARAAAATTAGGS